VLPCRDQVLVPLGSAPASTILRVAHDLKAFITFSGVICRDDEMDVVAANSQSMHDPGTKLSDLTNCQFDNHSLSLIQQNS
jgi:hypothetical protein